jgi:energy-coupling factor transporter ATP-binding protein EcfA2
MSGVRLAAIQLCGYRGFPNPVVLWLSTHDAAGVPTGKGRNLLLYGENGSGKSSLGKAIRDFLDFRSSAPKFDEFAYRYADPPRTDRGIKLIFDDPGVDPLAWNPTDRETAHKDFADMARSRGWLDYRLIWRASEVQYGSDSVEVFRQLVEEIVPGCLPPAGGAETFGELWAQITDAAETRPTRTTYRWPEVDELEDDISNFNDSLKTFLEKIQSLTNDLLKAFTPTTSVVLDWKGGATYRSAARGTKFWNGSVRMSMADRGGDALKNPSEFLNEARLTAIGLCLYLAGMSQSIPPKRTDGSTYPRLLVLDDVLLSLDMMHRQPLLKILSGDKFKEWQIFLLTHDRAWYEIAKQRLGDWAHYELFAQQVGDYEQPILQPDQPHLDRARMFISPPAGSGVPVDLKAAAVHLRTEFELILKRACEGLALKVPFRRNPREVNANGLWSALHAAELAAFPVRVEVSNKAGEKVRFWRSEKPRKVVYDELRDRVSFALSWVLNPLSHSETIERYRDEIQDAVGALEELSRVVSEGIAKKSVQESLARSTLLRTLLQKKPPVGEIPQTHEIDLAGDAGDRARKDEETERGRS